MKKLTLVIVLLATSVWGQYVRTAFTPTAAGANNVAIVGAHLGGTTGANAAPTTYNLGGNTVTAGNTVLCGVAGFVGGSGYTFLAGDFTKSAGTATVGTIVLDKQVAIATNTSGVAIYRVPITGTGTITLQLSFTGQTFGNIACAEFSGVNTVPLSTSGTNTGTGTAQTTGSVSSADKGVLFYVAAEDSSANFASRTFSDVLVKTDDNGVSDLTYIVQYKIVSASPNTLTDTTGTTSMVWRVAYALYKSS